MDGPSVSVIVPVYEEESAITSNVVALISKLEDLKFKRILSDYELLVFLSHERYRALSSYLTRNENIMFFERGKVNKIRSIFSRGIRLASSEYVGLLSPYNQVGLDVLEDILKALSNHDMVVAYIGNYFARPWHRIIASIANTILVNLLFNLNLKYYHLNFYRTVAVKKVKFTTDSHAAMIEAAVWMAKSGANVAQVPFEMVPHNFKSKSRAFEINNIADILKTYARLFRQIMILRKRIDL